jgi:hypothetical protein
MAARKSLKRKGDVLFSFEQTRRELQVYKFVSQYEFVYEQYMWALSKMNSLQSEFNRAKESEMIASLHASCMPNSDNADMAHFRARIRLSDAEKLYMFAQTCLSEKAALISMGAEYKKGWTLVIYSAFWNIFDPLTRDIILHYIMLDTSAIL